MRVRGLVLVATALALAAVPAGAAEQRKRPPARSCHLIVDPAGDTAFDPPVSGAGAYDILFADAASGTRGLVAVLRVARHPADSDPAPAGAEWRLGLTSGGVRYEFAASRGATGRTSSRATIGDAVQKHTFKVVGPAMEWRLTLPRAQHPLAVSAATAETRYGPVTVDTGTGPRTADGKGCARGK